VLPDASIEPLTMVVEPVDAFFTKTAVLTVVVDVRLADPTKLFSLLTLRSPPTLVDVYMAVQMNINGVNAAGLIASVQ